MMRRSGRGSEAAPQVGVMPHAQLAAQEPGKTKGKGGRKGKEKGKGKGEEVQAVDNGTIGAAQDRTPSPTITITESLNNLRLSSNGDAGHPSGSSEGQIIPRDQILNPPSQSTSALPEGVIHSRDLDADGVASSPEFLGFDDGEFDGLKGSDNDFVDASVPRTPEGAKPPVQLRRSPKKYSHTTFTDFKSGLKTLSDLTFEEKVRVAVAFAKEDPTGRSPNSKQRLASLLSDFDIALAVMEQIKAASTETVDDDRQVRKEKTTIATNANADATTITNAPTKANAISDDVFQVMGGGGPSGGSNVIEFNIVDQFLDKRTSPLDARMTGKSKTNTSTETQGQPRYPRGHAPAIPATNGHSSGLESIAEFDDYNGGELETHFSHATNSRALTQGITMAPPSWSINSTFRNATNPPLPRIAPITPGASALPVNPTFSRPVNPPTARSANPSVGRSSNPSTERYANPPSRAANLPPARPPTQNTSRPSHMMPLYEDGDIEDVEEERGTVKTTKRRTRKKPAQKKKGRSTKKAVDSQGEVFDLDGAYDDDDGELEGDAILDYRLSYYHGELRKLLVRAIFFMRLFLLCTEGFPSKEDLIKWAEKSFAASCQMAYGINFKDRMPEFTDGMSTLLQNEGWGVRGKVKKAAAKLVEKYYNLSPPANKYARFPNAADLEISHVEQRVRTLLGPQSLYLRGYVPSQGDDIPYAHPAIKGLIHVLVFSKKASKRPLAEQDLDAFNPIPLRLIAYACTALLNVLEEYKSGEQVVKDFSEADYSNYYRILAQNLEEMEYDESFAAVLQDIREDIFDSGCQMLNMSVHDEYERPPAPFVPTGRNNLTA